MSTDEKLNHIINKLCKYEIQNIRDDVSQLNKNMNGLAQAITIINDDISKHKKDIENLKLINDNILKKDTSIEQSLSNQNKKHLDNMKNLSTLT